MTKINKNFSDNPPINYLSKDFASYKENLLNFAKTYYKDTYKDFSEGSTGVMFIDLASYVGDVLSYYIDYQFNEGFLVNATERENLLIASRFLGYRPKLSSPSNVVIEVFHVIPSIRDDSGEFVPDYRFALSIRENMELTSTGGIRFITTQPIDFSSSSSEDPTEVSVFSRNESGEIDSFLLKKLVPAKSGQIVTENFNITGEQQFLQLVLNRQDAIEILSVVDSDGNNWYEVDYLAQDTVPTEKQNVDSTDKRFFRFRDSVPYILNSLKTSRKFTTRISSDDTMVLEFGSGENVEFQDEEINSITNPVTSNTSNPQINPLAFLKGSSYGLIPTNTTLTVRYLAGGGVEANVASGEINDIIRVEYTDKLNDLPDWEQQLKRTIRNSLRVFNPEAATGGNYAESDESIRQNALLNFNSQNRAVTREDYLVRTLSMPSKYGSITKAYVSSEDDIDSQSNNPFVKTDKSFGVNLYILTKDEGDRLTTPNEAVIRNLSEYLKRYRMITDDITIFSGNIINVGVYFEIMTFKGENKQQVLFECIETIKDFFYIEDMNFNQPINLNTLSLNISNVDGVQSVTKLKLYNLTAADGEYSPNKYNIDNATLNGMVYPSLDPSIFEVKYPDKDIKGKVL